MRLDELDDGLRVPTSSWAITGSSVRSWSKTGIPSTTAGCSLSPMPTIFCRDALCTLPRFA